jgi:hypothetical protein
MVWGEGTAPAAAAWPGGGVSGPGGAGQRRAGGGGSAAKAHAQVELLREGVNVQRVI